jgi:flagellar biosynthetic protein FliO
VPCRAAGTIGTDLVSAAGRMIAMLAITVGLLLILAYFFKKANLFGKTFINSSRHLQVIETLYLGPKKSLALVRVGGECIVIGITQSSISCIAAADTIVLNEGGNALSGSSTGSTQSGQGSFDVQQTHETPKRFDLQAILKNIKKQAAGS